VLFGLWNVVAVVDIAECSVSDTLSFMVGWIIELIKVETLDVNNFLRYYYAKGEQMHFRLTVRNIAMTTEISTFVLDVYDNLNVPFGHIVISDKQIKPGISLLLVEDLAIPEWVSLGDGLVLANAYTALPALGGVPWCPQVSTTFSIMKVIHDVAVIDVYPSVHEASQCQAINVTVVVRNEGNVAETFDVAARYDSKLINTFTITNLSPKAEKTIVLTWFTNCIPPGNYTLSAEASVVSGEVNIENNKFVDGVVRITGLPSPPVEWAWPKWLLALLFVLAVILGAILVLLIAILILCWSKRKKEEEEKTTVPYSIGHLSPVKKCSVCGREFPGVYTFCPYCMSFHGKDY
jgi:phage shock protein PspC (stress-responsive transcriptional regulator)